MAGRKCLACHSPNREAIDSALAAGVPYGQISRDQKLSPSALSRHARRCIPDAVAASETRRDAATVATAISAQDQVRACLDDLRRLAKLAEGSDDMKSAVAAVKGIPAAVDLLARLTGELKPAGATVNLQLVTVDQAASMPAVLEFLRRLHERAYDALAPWPGAYEALGRAMGAGEPVALLAPLEREKAQTETEDRK